MADGAHLAQLVGQREQRGAPCEERGRWSYHPGLGILHPRLRRAQTHATPATSSPWTSNPNPDPDPDPDPHQGGEYGFGRQVAHRPRQALTLTLALTLTPTLPLSLARYGVGVSPNQRHVRYFWAAMRRFTPEQRSAFMRFVWGRSRLPASAAEWGDMKLTIHTKHTAQPDRVHPMPHRTPCPNPSPSPP